MNQNLIDNDVANNSSLDNTATTDARICHAIQDREVVS